MKTKSMFKILIIIFIIINVFALNNVVYASSLSDAITGADNFIQAGVDDTDPVISDENLKSMSNMLYNALLAVATVIAVIVGLIIGIQFMTGSVAQRAEVKKTLIPYIAGCIVIFGAFGIWKIVVNILSATQ